jgi:hypothetical protein
MQQYLKLFYHSGQKEALQTNSLEQAEAIIRKRNAPFIKQATFGGKVIELGKFQKIYGEPKTCLAQFSLRDIMRRYASKRKRA